jgi:broad specificity phosphatase PhoE
MQLYLIRHAQSTNNALDDPSDRDCDPTLTELGEHQAQVLAHHLATQVELVPPPSTTNGHERPGYVFTRFICSPMWRALQTADPIGRALGLAPEVWADIHEQGGIYLEHSDERGLVGYPGVSRRQIQTVFPNYIVPDEVTERGWWNREYEEWPACHQRAARVAQKLRAWAADDDGHDQSIAMVSHGGFVDALLKALFGQAADRRLFYYHYNTAISRVDFREDGRLNVRYLNRVDHLLPDWVT